MCNTFTQTVIYYADRNIKIFLFFQVKFAICNL